MVQRQDVRARIIRPAPEARCCMLRKVQLVPPASRSVTESSDRGTTRMLSARNSTRLFLRRPTLLGVATAVVFFCGSLARLYPFARQNETGRVRSTHLIGQERASDAEPACSDYTCVAPV